MATITWTAPEPREPRFEDPEFYSTGVLARVVGRRGTAIVLGVGERYLSTTQRRFRRPQEFRDGFADGRLPADGDDDGDVVWINNGWFEVAIAGADPEEADDVFHTLTEAIAAAEQLAGPEPRAPAAPPTSMRAALRRRS